MSLGYITTMSIEAPIDLTESPIDLISFTVAGNPTAQARAVICRGKGAYSRVWMRDPSSVKKQIFHDAVKLLVFGIGSQNQPTEVVFKVDSPIIVDITFCMKPPQDHFVNGNTSRGTLKPSALTKWPTMPDVDNLDKFVLDSLQGLLYDNDSQVICQRIQKVYHHQAPFTGQTMVCIRRANEDNYGSLPFPATTTPIM